MTISLKTIVVFLGILIIAVLAFAVFTEIQLSQTKNELMATNGQLLSTTKELEDTRAELLATQNELTNTESELAGTKEKLGSTTVQLAATSTQLDLTKNQLDDNISQLTYTKDQLSIADNNLKSTQSELTTSQAALTQTQQKLTLAQENLKGLGITISASKECADVTLVDNPQAVNPTLSQLLNFLSRDKTNTNTYIRGVYDCSEFSRDVHNNAEAAGIRTAEVQIRFKNETTGHALNAFLTTDCGMVYIDCTDSPDTIARVVSGMEYRAVEVNRVSGNNVRNNVWWNSLITYYYMPGTFGDCVTSSIRIYW